MAKLIAWILISVSGMGMFFCLFTAVLLQENGIYEQTEKQIRTEANKIYSNRYSAKILDYMDVEGANESYFADKNFYYGLIQADSFEELKKMDFNDETVYLESNFSEKVELEDLHVFEWRMNPNTQVSWRNPDSLTGYYWLSNPAFSEYAVDIEGFVYDTSSGIIYCQAGNLYYPVKMLCFEVSDMFDIYGDNFEIRQYYQYDAKNQAYVKYNEQEAESVFATDVSEAETAVSEDTVSDVSILEIYTDQVEISTETSEIIDVEQEGVLYISCEGIEVKAEDYGFYEAACKILGMDRITLEDFEGTFLSRKNWNWISGGFYRDGVFYHSGNYYQIELEDVSLSENQIAEGENYWISVQDEKVYTEGPDSLGKNYFVISYVPETLTFEGDWWNGDLFVKADHLIHFAYQVRYKIFWILAACVIGSLVSFIFLVSSAGHRKNKDGITVVWINKIPLEINIFCFWALECFLVLVVLESVSYEIDDITSIFWIVLAGILILLAGLLAVAFSLDIAVRAKLGKWWRNTITYKICHWVWTGCSRIFQAFWQHLGMLMKLVLGFSVVTGLEVICIFLIYYLWGIRFAITILCWVFLKVVQLVVLLKCVSEMLRLKEAGEHIAAGDLEYQVDTSKMMPDFKEHGENLNSVNVGLSKAVNERMKSEHFKTELITNVSHDIKTPLTSIINYVDLLKKEEISNETVQEYIEVLDRQSNRLKKLIEDLMEASKASTGNLEVNLEKLEAGVFMVQTVGEFEEKTKNCNLELMIKKPKEPVYIMADGRHFWRVIDNLMNNICKYAQPGTRVYINLEKEGDQAKIIFRNTSKYSLNISSEELMERFVRGDSSRNTEGHGLGLSIAKSLMELMQGQFELVVDGDLFKVILTFALC